MTCEENSSFSLDLRLVPFRELEFHCSQKQASTQTTLDNALTLPTAAALAAATADNSGGAVATSNNTHATLQTLASIHTRFYAHIHTHTHIQSYRVKINLRRKSKGRVDRKSLVQGNSYWGTSEY